MTDRFGARGIEWIKGLRASMTPEQRDAFEEGMRGTLAEMDRRVAIFKLLEHPDIAPLVPRMLEQGTLEVDPGTYAGVCEAFSQAGLDDFEGGVPGLVAALIEAARGAAWKG